MKAKERIRSIIEGRDAGQWPNTSKTLYGASRIYGILSQLRCLLYDRGHLRRHRLPCRVISVGNLTVGGTGKTPMTIYVARYIQSIGYRAVVLSRGYGGRYQSRGGVVSDGQSIYLDPDCAGDEAFMMAAKLIGIPVLVGKDRYRSGVKAIQTFQPEVIILDDGYQHLRLQRDLNLLLLDARSPIGNGNLLPRGPIRAPISSSNQADAIIFTRCPSEKQISMSFEEMDLPSTAFFTRHKPIVYKAVAPNGAKTSSYLLRLAPLETSAIVGAKVLAFSGIADNLDFRKSLISLGMHINEFLEFEDHYRYTDGDIEEIQRRSRNEGAEWLATTEKDFYRICHRLDSTIRLIVVGIDIEFIPNPDEFNELLHNACQDLNKRIQLVVQENRR